MNKLEKIKGDSMSELEEVEVNETAETSEEKEKKKFFSLFTFWHKANPELTEGEQLIESGEMSEKKGFMKYINLRTGALVASLVVIAVAGYINIRYSANSDLDSNGINDALDEINASLLERGEEAADESQDYFALSVINRQRVRDEAMEILLDLTESDMTDAEAKADAYSEMTRMANEITNEANIESLVKAKGFTNCVAVVSGDDVNVVVESDGLTVNEVAQIKEIVYLECGAHPDNVKIIEKTGV